MKLDEFKRSWFVKEKYSIPLLASVLFTFLAFGIFISQYFTSDIITFAKNGDQLLEGFPMFIKMGHMLRTGVLNGTDTGIFNGGTELFYKIHMSKYLPFIFFAALGSYTAYRFAYILFFAIHFFGMLFFGQLLMKDYFGLSKAQALFVTCSCSLVFFTNTGFATFAIIPSLVYPMLYFILGGMKNGIRPVRCIIISFLYVLAFTSGHPTYSCAVAAIVFIVALIYGLTYLSGHITIKQCLIRLFVPAAIGAMVCFPFLLQILSYTNKYSVAPEIMNMAVALDLKTHISNFLAYFFNSVVIVDEMEQSRIFYVGLIWLVIMVIMIKDRTCSRFLKRERVLFWFIIVLTAITYIIALGTDTPLAVWLYGFVPIFGNQHLPVRYALILMPLFFLALGIGLKNIKANCETKIIQGFCYILSILLICAVLFRSSVMLTSLISDVNLFLIETALSLLILYYALYHGINDRKVLFFASFLIFFVSCRFLYAYNDVSTYKGNIEERSIAFNQRYQKSIDTFVDSLELDKYNYRYLELDTREAVPVFWPNNYSWYGMGRNKISNYLGYSLHAYISRDYKYTIQYSSFNAFDWKYLLDTRADFLVLDSETINNNPDLYGFIIDSSKQPQQLNSYLTMYPLKKFLPRYFSNAASVYDYLQDSRTSFDNGYFYSPFLSKEDISEFRTNDSSYFSLSFDTASNNTHIQFLPFPSHYYKYYIDDVEYIPIIKNGCAYFNVERGKHKIEIIYDNQFENMVIFVFGMYYLLFIASVGVWYGKKIIYKKYRENR